MFIIMNDCEEGHGMGTVECNERFVKKYYSIVNYRRFLNELKIYKLNLPYVPKLLDYDIWNRTLTIEKIAMKPMSKELYEQLKWECHTRFHKDTGLYHNDLHNKNILLGKNNK